jgi:hypothetical protein
MPRLRVSTVIDASTDRVWDDISDISSHVEWMHDAHSITFRSESESGVGTTFDCETRIGPFRLTDRMEITSWKPGREMGVRHAGLVTGTGVFTLTPLREKSGRGRKRQRTEQTRFEWSERLAFPWWMGGPLGGLAARPVLRWVWKRNLKNLRSRFAI